MVSRIVTGAHYGLRGWLLQRLSAALMAGCVLFIAGWLSLHPHPGCAQWAALFANEAVRSVSSLFLFALFGHAWVGVRDVVMDYVKPAGARLAIHAGVIAVLMGYAIWAVRMVWQTPMAGNP